jgi:hypothetical protein
VEFRGEFGKLNMADVEEYKNIENDFYSNNSPNYDLGNRF